MELRWWDRCCVTSQRSVLCMQHHNKHCPEQHALRPCFMPKTHLSGRVHGGGGLVQAQHRHLLQRGARQAHQLLLAQGPGVAAGGIDHAVQAAACVDLWRAGRWDGVRQEQPKA